MDRLSGWGPICGLVLAVREAGARRWRNRCACLALSSWRVDHQVTVSAGHASKAAPCPTCSAPVASVASLIGFHPTAPS